MTIPWEFVSIFLLRLGLVALFVPFSVYYMLRDFRGAARHAASAGVGRSVAQWMILAAILLKLVATLGVLTGVADRLCFLLLATFCVGTALMYKRFWTGDGVAFASENANLPIFWDFLKNISLAAAFILIGFGSGAESFRQGLEEFIQSPFASSRPYGGGILR
ncbi:DoxX family membrane protein [Erythrobacter sp. HL-111]|uniref:DoxX family membrane protein n=1 Tax=Erythrobacter sp. HL-111 TaxID=1798193 RepID=UPI00087B7D21|nr:DoxX family membrane protein [Erythrobacter sp. HL-111]SDS96304.1 putative oxidoreductase [Erythrobacter sp. HL-111]